MVQCFLSCARADRLRTVVVTTILVVSILLTPAFAAKKKKNEAEPLWPELLLEQGRKLTYEQTFKNEREVRGKRGFWNKFLDVVAGEPDFRQMVRPYSVAVDSRGRIIVTDPAIAGIHIFDAAEHKYKLIDRWDKSRDEMVEPQCVAVDANDNIYVTDSRAGKIFLFDASGKYRGVFGSLKGGEGFYKRPTGIAIDPQTQEIFVTDTLRDKIFVLDMEGRVVRSFGKHGAAHGEFNLPTEVHVRNGIVAVVDAMNFRIELFDRNGNYQRSVGVNLNPAGVNARGPIYRPKGIAIDSEDHIYLVEGEWGLVQVFDRNGTLLYHFGNGTGFGQFMLPTGLFIDSHDKIYLVDSYNRRVQVFQYHALKGRAGEGTN